MGIRKEARSREVICKLQGFIWKQPLNMDEKIRDKKNKREKKDTKKALREHLHLTISRSSQRVKKRHVKR